MNSDSSSQKSKSTITKEELFLSNTGDVFDPMLMTYVAGFGLGLTQQKFESDTRSGSHSGQMETYRLKMNFLANKPYPFIVNMHKNDTYVSRAFQSPLHMENTYTGIFGRLRVPNWPMTYSWDENKIEQRNDVGLVENGYTRTSERFGYSVSHDFSKRSSMWFRVDIDDVLQEQSSGFSRETKTARYNFNHNLIFGNNDQYRLDSLVSYIERESFLDVKTLDILENLNVKNSETLSSFYNANYSKTTFESSETETVGGLAGLNHRLFDNFTTNASLFGSKTEFGSGSESTGYGGRVRLDYSRDNPWGRLKTFYDVRRTFRESKGLAGANIVTDESHIFSDPDAIELDERGILIDTIEVTNSDGTEVYTRGVGGDYIVQVIGDRVELIVDTGDLDFPNIVDTQEVLVSYLYEVEGSLTENGLRQYFRVEQKFDNDIMVYYTHRSDEFQIETKPASNRPDREFTADTYGMSYNYKNIFMGAEHSENESFGTSTESDRVYLGADWALTPRTSFNGRVSQSWLNTTGVYNRDVSLFRVNGSLRTRLSRYLRLLGTAEYRKEESSSTGDTNGFRAGVAAEYNRSALSLRAGLDYYYLDHLGFERGSTMFYINLTRRF